MYKSEAETALRRAMEDLNNSTCFTEEQIVVLAEAMRKIASRIVEEALSTYKPPSR